MSTVDERLHILQMIGDGKITAAEGLRLLNALSGVKAEARAEGGAESGGETPPAGAEPSPRIPAWEKQKTGVDELILALEDSTSPENPLFVDVHEGEDGERVQVYIG